MIDTFSASRPAGSDLPQLPLLQVVFSPERVKLITHIHLLPTLRMRGVIPPFPNVLSLHDSFGIAITLLLTH